MARLVPHNVPPRNRQDKTIRDNPKAPEVILGDANRDGIVDFFDIARLIELLASRTYLEGADCNQDGEVDFLDISPFIAILTEPSCDQDCDY